MARIMSALAQALVILAMVATLGNVARYVAWPIVVKGRIRRD